MPSTNKTEKLGLNQWVLSDKPAMNDFNSDNKVIEEKVAIKNGELQTSLYAEKAQKLTQILIPSGKDLNEYIEPAIYSSNSSVLNLPTKTSFYTVYVTRVNNDPNYIQQLAISANTGDTYTRVKAGGAWKEWVKNWDSGNFDPSKKIDVQKTTEVNDFDFLIKPGIYSTNPGVKNSPSSSYCSVYVTNSAEDDNYTQQFVVTIEGLIYLRVRFGGTWNPWKKMDIQS